MFKNIFIAGLVLASVGCSSVSNYLVSPTAQLQLSQQTTSSVLELQALTLENAKALSVQIQNDSQRLTLPDVNSTVALYKIPTNGQELTLEVVSYFDRTFFAPSVMLFDDKGNKLVNIPNAEFSFQDKNLLHSYRQRFVRPIVPPPETKSLYVLIYTTEESVKESTQMWVKVEGFNEEQVTIDHSYNGRVSVKYTQVEKEDLSNLTLSNSSDVSAVEVLSSSVIDNPSESKPALESENISSTVTQKPEAVSIEELKQLIEQGDTEQALKILNQAETIQ